MRELAIQQAMDKITGVIERLRERAGFSEPPPYSRLDRYRAVIAGGGHRRLFPDEETARRHENELEGALHDLNACARCIGDGCKTIINRYSVGWIDNHNRRRVKTDYRTHVVDDQGNQKPRKAMYYDVDYRGSKFYGHPHFIFRPCPGVAKRRQEALGQLERVRGYVPLSLDKPEDGFDEDIDDVAPF